VCQEEIFTLVSKDSDVNPNMPIQTPCSGERSEPKKERKQDQKVSR
jgi:hypothetical protein